MQKIVEIKIIPYFLPVVYYFRLNRNCDPQWGAQGGKFNSTSFNAPELNKLNSYTNLVEQPMWQ